MVFHSGLTIWKYECKASTILEVCYFQRSRRGSRSLEEIRKEERYLLIFFQFLTAIDRSIIVSSLHEHPHTTRIVNSRVKGWWGGWTTTTHIFFQTGPN